MNIAARAAPGGTGDAKRWLPEHLGQRYEEQRAQRFKTAIAPFLELERPSV